jgi:hypothetical protein
MYKRGRTFISVILIILVLSASLNIGSVFAAPQLVTYSDLFSTVNMRVGGETSGLPIGSKNIPFNLSDIEMHLNDFQVASQSSLSAIKVYANGLTDETYKFDITLANGILRLALKKPVSGAEYMQPYQLIKHALYNVYIPKGAFKNSDGTKINDAVNYCFVTNTDEGAYRDDILVKVSPADTQTCVDNKTGKITFEFIDAISLKEGVLDNIADYIEISTQPYNENIPGYKIDPFMQESDAISNYNITLENNKLVLQAKDGVFKDYAIYTVKLKDGTVHLKNSPVKINNNAAGVWEVVSFRTNNMLESTYPANNQKDVEVEPTIRFTFKHGVQFTDVHSKSSITISSDAHEYSVRIPEDVKLSGDKKSLLIDVNDVENERAPLRSGTLYKVTIPQGTVSFKDYTDSNGHDIVNDEINLFFVTIGNGEGPAVTGFSSNTGKTDDITSMGKTQLDSDGAIYIHFDRSIREDKQVASLSLLQATKLYKIPKASEQAYDPYGQVYDKTYVYYPAQYGSGYKIVPEAVHNAGKGPESLENSEHMQVIPISKVEVVQPNIIKVTPGFRLENLNKYKLEIDNRVIEDVNGYNVEAHIEQTFWTKAKSQAVNPTWQGADAASARLVTENAGAANKSYTLYGVPRFGENTPLSFIIDSEVVVKAQEEVVEQRPELVKRITFDALKNISLVDVNNPHTAQKQIRFSKYRLEYFFEGGVKKTKLCLYPDRTLDSGKAFKLNIPAGVLESRSGGRLGALEVNFTLDGDSEAPRGIYSLENHQLRAVELAGTGKWEFYIKGYNFKEDIFRVELVPTSGRALAEFGQIHGTITISSEDIRFQDITTIKVTLRGSTAKMLSDESRTGTYSVKLYFSDAPELGYTSPVELTIAPKGRPEVAGKYPYSTSESERFDENALNPTIIDGVTRYFLKVTFDDQDGKLAFNSTSGLSILRDSSYVYAQGSGVSVIDTEFLTALINMGTTARKTYVDAYIFKSDAEARRAYLYIPIKLLRPHTTYNVTIMPDVVYFSDMQIVEGGSEMITWSFTTMPSPVVSKVDVGSLVEDYDEDEPIILTGGFFYDSTVRVFFNNYEADDVVVRTDAAGEKYLEVYLPGGRRRLDPGTYNITVQNDVNHTYIIYGSLSIVEEGKHIPNEIVSIKSEFRQGDVLSDLKISEDTIQLKSSYSDDRYLKLDMDELMGKDVLSRKIEIDGSTRKKIGILDTRSKWCDIEIYGLTLSYDSDDDKIILALGRTPPSVTQTLKAKLKGRAVKSDFIQVIGANFAFSWVTLDIPFRNSNGKELKALRYDEQARNWQEVVFAIDPVDAKVKVDSDRPGIFVIVE